MAAPSAPILLDLLHEGLARGDQVALTVSSDSMRPLLRAGDVVILEAANVAILASGDIITTIDPTEPAALLTHRFYGLIAGDIPLLITRGDRVIRFDSLSPAHHFVGRVVARQRGDNTLLMTSGAGATLNGRLACLASDEVRRIAGEPLPAAPTRAGFERIAAQLVANARRPRVRLYRRWIALEAAGLARSIGSDSNRDAVDGKRIHA